VAVNDGSKRSGSYGICAAERVPGDGTRAVFESSPPTQLRAARWASSRRRHRRFGAASSRGPRVARVGGPRCSARRAEKRKGGRLASRRATSVRPSFPPQPPPEINRDARRSSADGRRPPHPSFEHPGKSSKRRGAENFPVCEELRRSIEPRYVDAAKE
jgi:hypothetical protein